jgi:phosphoribosylformylglycinamidine cyclo-ligase
VSGTIVGVVEKSRILDGTKTIRPGDAVLGLASSGLHTNGYSLARKLFFERLKLKPSSYVAELGGTIGDELLKVHLSYGPVAQRMLKKFGAAIKALAHITGGGFLDNIPRVLPKNCDALIRKDAWELPPLFRMIKEKGGVAEAELYHVFNMGIGMVLVVVEEKAEAILRSIRAAQFAGWKIGEVTTGRGRTVMV